MLRLTCNEISLVMCSRDPSPLLLVRAEETLLVVGWGGIEYNHQGSQHRGKSLERLPTFVTYITVSFLLLI